MKFEAVVSSSPANAVKNYEAGLCSVLTSDVSQLYASRLRLAKPGDHVILPDIISKEPLGPAVRQNDLQWANVVKWVHFAMIDGEELGVSTKTLAQALRSRKPEVMRLVGTEGNFGEQIGLTNAWAANIIGLVGNYGEVYERNVGTDPNSEFHADSTNCGTWAASNTRRRFAEAPTRDRHGAVDRN